MVEYPALDVGDLRMLTGVGSFPRRAGVVHVPTGLMAMRDDYLSVTLNRTEAYKDLCKMVYEFLLVDAKLAPAPHPAVVEHNRKVLISGIHYWTKP